jgi:hypothetical protein
MQLRDAVGGAAGSGGIREPLPVGGRGFRAGTRDLDTRNAEAKNIKTPGREAKEKQR